jgi:acyl-coenzyme A thioesterase 13
MDESLREQFAAFMEGDGFDQCLAGLELVAAGGGHVRARLVVGRRVQNFAGGLHGGAIATLVDVVGTFAIVTADKDGRPGVSTDLNVSYCGPAIPDEAIVVEARVLRAGKSFAFVSVEVTREGDGKLVAQGRMTKFLGA